MTTVAGVVAQSSSTVTHPLVRCLEKANNELMEYAQSLLIEISNVDEQQFNEEQDWQRRPWLSKMRTRLTGIGEQNHYDYVPNRKLHSKTKSGLEFHDAVDILRNARLISIVFALAGNRLGVRLTEEGKAFVADLKAESEEGKAHIVSLKTET